MTASLKIVAEEVIIKEIAIQIADISCDGDESMKPIRKCTVSFAALPSEEENHAEELNTTYMTLDTNKAR